MSQRKIIAAWLYLWACCRYRIHAQTTPAPTVSAIPSVSPTPAPTVSVAPSVSPSVSMMPSVSAAPSVSPSVSMIPSSSPSVSMIPSSSPSANPSTSPSASPSASPSTSPSASPSTTPSAAPSSAPSVAPTEEIVSVSVDDEKKKILFFQDSEFEPQFNGPNPRPQSTTRPALRPSTSRPTTRPTLRPTPRPVIHLPRPTDEPTSAPHPETAALLQHYWRIGMPTNAPTGVFNFRFTKPPTEAPSVAPKLAPLLAFYWQIGNPTNVPTADPNPPTTNPSSAPSYDPNDATFLDSIFGSSNMINNPSTLDQTDIDANDQLHVITESVAVPLFHSTSISKSEAIEGQKNKIDSNQEAVSNLLIAEGIDSQDQYQVSVSAELEGIPEILEVSFATLVETTLVQYLSDEIMEINEIPVFFLKAKVNGLEVMHDIFGPIKMDILLSALAVGGTLDANTLQQTIQETLDNYPNELEDYLRGAIQAPKAPRDSASQQNPASLLLDGGKGTVTMLTICVLLCVVVLASFAFHVASKARHRIQDQAPKAKVKTEDFWA